MVLVPEQNLSGTVLTPIRYVTLRFGNRRGAASLRHRNRGDIIVLVCEQKPYRVSFSYQRKTYPV